jgi:arylsulfatase A-like enzyme
MVKRITRRDFNWLVTAGVVAGVVGLSMPRTVLSGPATKTQRSRPNIVLILADDAGFSDFGCYGGEVQTPNIDILARGGMRLTQFYNAAKCCPTRASLLTGLYPHQAGMGNMVDDPVSKQDNPYTAYRGNLAENCITIAEALKQAGYNTLMSGKWHVGAERPHWPCDRGFDRYYGLIGGASNYWDIRYGAKAPYLPEHYTRTMAIDNERIVPNGDNYYITDAFTDHAVRYLDDYGRRDEPFFLHLAYTAPHIPLHARPEDIAKYREMYRRGWDQLRRERYARMREMDLINESCRLSPRDPQCEPWEEVEDKDHMALKMAIYAAQIDRMDQGIGRVMDKLKALGEWDNTLVLFLSDNGGCAAGGPLGWDYGRQAQPPGGPQSYMSYGQAWANVSDCPFRRYKLRVHEGGIATPLIAHWPVTIPQNSMSHQVGHVIDLMPTILDAAGAEYPKVHGGHKLLPLEGESLLPVFRGKQREERRSLYWEHQGNRAVRSGKWKLVAFHDEPWELYDMVADRSELDNLVDQHPEKAEALLAQYQLWARRCGVQPWPLP